MKILVITDLYPIKPDEKKTPKTILNFVQGWQDLGHDVFIIKPNFIPNSFLRKKPFYKSGIYENIENINFWTPFWGNINKKIEKFGYNKEEFTPDLVIAHMPCGLITANKFKQPFIAGVHVSDIEVLTNPIYSIYFKKELENAYQNATKIACRSEVLRRKFLNLYPQFTPKTFVAFSGIDEQIITRRTWQKKDRYKILTCANLIKRKNIDKLILACKNIDNIDLTVIGDGVEMDKLKKLSSKTIFKGHLPKNKVLEEMRDSDIFILPSVNETFGMVYLEAMASGCVTVCTANDGIDGIIKNGENGYLTSTKPHKMETTLLKILENDNSQILENSYNTILNYTKEKACLNYLNHIL